MKYLFKNIGCEVLKMQFCLSDLRDTKTVERIKTVDLFLLVFYFCQFAFMSVANRGTISQQSISTSLLVCDYVMLKMKKN